MGINELENLRAIKVYKDGRLAERTELVDFDVNKYTEDCGFLGIYSSFCFLNMTTIPYERILTLDQIKEYQKGERDPDAGVDIKIREPSCDTKKKKGSRPCILI